MTDKGLNNGFKRIILAALFAALTCVATLSVRIPVSATGGYIHPGDALVILSGIILGPYFGFLSAGIGSALADLMGGYAFYAPVTFVIKGVIAIASAMLYRRIGRGKKSRYTAVIFGGVADTIIVAAGYFLYESLIYGVAAAALAVLPNVVQGVSGLIIALILYPILIAIPDVRAMAFRSSKMRR